MLKKIIFTVILICCICVLPSYTNTCARPDAKFLRSDALKNDDAATAVKPVLKAAHGLEVFPLGLISIQL